MYRESMRILRKCCPFDDFSEPKISCHERKMAVEVRRRNIGNVEIYKEKAWNCRKDRFSYNKTPSCKT